MKKNIKFALALLLIVMISGCSQVDAESRLQQQINEKLMEEIEGTEDYKAYLELKEKGLIDESGNYVGEVVETMAEPQKNGDIRVTFADNLYIDVYYFYDEELTKPVDTAKCYINAGDSIYCSAPEVKSRVSSAYEFVGFRVWAYGADGNKTQYDGGAKGNLVLSIPEGSKSTEFSVEPVGEYRDRTLHLNDYYYKFDGTKNEPYGSKWVIDDVMYDKDTAVIQSLAQYDVKYHFDADKFYVKSTSPECFAVDDMGGTVYFYATSALDENDTYSVELSPYTVVNINPADGAKYVTVNGENQTLPLTLNSVKPGDKVTIKTSDEFKAVCDQAEMSPYEKHADGYLFSLTVPEGYDQLDVKVRKWSEKVIYFECGVNVSADDGDLLKIDVGEQHFTYNDFIKVWSKRDITMREFDTVRLILDDDINDNPNTAFEISVNGSRSQYLYKASESSSIILPYDQVETIKINKLEGYVFSYKKLDNGEIEAEYLVNGTKIREGQFLPKNTEVTIKITYFPNHYSWCDKRFDSSTMTRTVKISGKTQLKDFNIEYR